MVALRSGDNLRQIRGSGRSRLRKSAGARRFLCTARRLLPRLSAAAKRRKGESALTPLVTMATAKSCPLPVPSSQIWRLLASAGFCWPHCWPRRCTRPVACDTSDMHAKCSTMRRDILAATCIDRVATVAAPVSAQHAEKATEVSARARHDGGGPLSLLCESYFHAGQPAASQRQAHNARYTTAMLCWCVEAIDGKQQTVAMRCKEPEMFGRMSSPRRSGSGQVAFAERVPAIAAADMLQVRRKLTPQTMLYVAAGMPGIVRILPRGVLMAQEGFLYIWSSVSAQVAQP